ncbi:MAG TPA: hypothetical protein DEQ56_08260 [Bacteroidetes bacterium]|nr:hypothetical protein [Bacteroidota bacterium]
MIELELSDIALLYKTVVVLPQDKTTKAVIETTTTVNADVPQLVKAERADHIVEPETPKKVEHPFVIVTSSILKDKYLQPDSSFTKIIQALQIPQVAEYVIQEDAFTANQDLYRCIWAIGISPATSEHLHNLGHQNLLISPDVLSLISTEEKTAMYAPLKQFIASNQKEISKL